VDLALCGIGQSRPPSPRRLSVLGRESGFGMTISIRGHFAIAGARDVPLAH